MVSMQAFGFQGEANVAVELVKRKSDAETAGDFLQRLESRPPFISLRQLTERRKSESANICEATAKAFQHSEFVFKARIFV